MCISRALMPILARMLVLRTGLALAVARLLCCSPAAKAASGWISASSVSSTSEAAAVGVALADGGVLFAGGENLSGTLTDAQRYDPATGEWAAAGHMSTDRSRFTSTRLLDGRVLVVGGQRAGTGATTSAELYDPAAGTWSRPRDGRGPHPSCRDAARRRACTVAGGTDFTNTFGGAELCDPATNTWSPAAPMTDERYAATATLLDTGRVLVTGGGIYSGSRQQAPSSTTRPRTRGGPARTSTSRANSIPQPAAGRDGADRRWDRHAGRAALRPPHATRSTLGPSCRRPRVSTATSLPGGDVLLAGGYRDFPLLDATTWRYRYGARVWVSAGQLNTARFDHVAAALFDGRVLVATGNGGSGRMNTAEVWTSPRTSIGELTPVDFGPVSVPVVRTVTVTNSGTDDLLIEDVKTNGAAFAVSADECSPVAVPRAQAAPCPCASRLRRPGRPPER